MFLRLRWHLLWDKFDRSFDLPPGPLGAIRHRLHGDVGLIAAGLVALGALPGGGGERGHMYNQHFSSTMYWFYYLRGTSLICGRVNRHWWCHRVCKGETKWKTWVTQNWISFRSPTKNEQLDHKTRPRQEAPFGLYSAIYIWKLSYFNDIFLTTTWRHIIVLLSFLHNFLVVLVNPQAMCISVFKGALLHHVSVICHCKPFQNWHATKIFIVIPSTSVHLDVSYLDQTSRTAKLIEYVYI